MKIKYLSHYTYYKYSLNENGCILSGNTACFAPLYSHGKNLNNGEVKIFVNRDPLVNEKNLDNYCLLTMDEVVEYLTWLQKMTGIELSISTDKDLTMTNTLSSTNYFFVNVSLENNTNFELKFILALIRDMYEFSFNLQTKAVFLMNDVDELCLLDLSERICLTKNSIPMINGNHSTYLSSIKSMNNKQFIERYEQKKRIMDKIHNFYINDGSLHTILKLDSIADTIESGKLDDQTTALLIEQYKQYK